MVKERLLERLVRQGTPNINDRRSPEELGKSSIVSYLSKLLNTRQGSVPIDPEYGLPDMSNIAGSFASGSINDIQRDILKQINTYEKRFLQVRITPLNEEREVITLKFQLSGMINVGSTTGPVLKELSMFLRINSAGYVRLEVTSTI